MNDIFCTVRDRLAKFVKIVSVSGTTNYATKPWRILKSRPSLSGQQGSS